MPTEPAPLGLEVGKHLNKKLWRGYILQGFQEGIIETKDAMTQATIKRWGFIKVQNIMKPRGMRNLTWIRPSYNY